MSIHENYNHTLRASYIGYISQAIVNNFAPLLFLTFQKTYGISLDKITLLVTRNFAVPLLVDFLWTGSGTGRPLCWPTCSVQGEWPGWGFCRS